MLSGSELGAAIRAALKKKGVSQKMFADAMGVTQPSVQEWLKYGCISKARISDLVAYFADIVPLSHWGLDFSGAPEQRATSYKNDAPPHWSMLDARQRRRVTDFIDGILSGVSDGKHHA